MCRVWPRLTSTLPQWAPCGWKLQEVNFKLSLVFKYLNLKTICGYLGTGSPRSVIDLDFTFWSMIHFNFCMYIQGVSQGSGFKIWHQIILLFFTPISYLGTLSIIKWHVYDYYSVLCSTGLCVCLLCDTHQHDTVFTQGRLTSNKGHQDHTTRKGRSPQQVLLGKRAEQHSPTSILHRSQKSTPNGLKA